MNFLLIEMANNLMEKGSLIRRMKILKVKNLKENCFKYLEESSKELLTQKILFAISELTAEKMGPVKLSEIAQKATGEHDKSKQDLVSLTLEKSILKCGLVEKLKYASNDVKYLIKMYNILKEKLEKNGLIISGTSPNGELVEIIEIKDHPWFVGCQFHPEFKSRPMNPPPLFKDFINASLEHTK